MPDINGLMAFLAVAKHGSFARAAKVLGVSASAVSKAVARMEAREGVVLLTRSTRALSLTDEGRRIRDVAAPLGDLMAEVSRIFDRQRGAVRGRVKLSAAVLPGRLLVIPALQGFLADHPDLDIEVSLTDRRVDMVAEGFDMSLRMVSDEPDSDLIATRLGTHRTVLVASPAYLDANGIPGEPADFHQHVCIAHRLRSSGRLRAWTFADHFEAPPWVPPAAVVIDDGDAALAMAAAGIGIAEVPDFAAHRAIASGKLRVVLPDGLAPGPPIVVTYPRASARAPRTAAVVAFLRGVFPRDPPWRVA